MVVIQSDRTVCATAERAEVDGHRYNREENNPRKWLGEEPHSSWRERRLFDWTYLAAQYRRSGNRAMEAYALQRRAAFEVE